MKSLQKQAEAIVLETGRASISVLQRRLACGYGEASKMLAEMERKEKKKRDSDPPR